jgi:AraC family transcriptional regulator
MLQTPGPDAGSGGGLAPRKLEQARAFIAGNLGRSVHVDEIAAHVGLSPFHFARMFKASTGESPHACVLRLRIEEAMRLLAEGDEPLAGIALRVGFRTQAHFTGVFHRQVGVTPRAYRRSRRDD